MCLHLDELEIVILCLYIFLRFRTRLYLLMQSTVRPCVMIVVLKQEIQILVRITNICPSPNPKIP